MSDQLSLPWQVPRPRSCSDQHTLNVMLTQLSQRELDSLAHLSSFVDQTYPSVTTLVGQFKAKAVLQGKRFLLSQVMHWLSYQTSSDDLHTRMVATVADRVNLLPPGRTAASRTLLLMVATNSRRLLAMWDFLLTPLLEMVSVLQRYLYCYVCCCCIVIVSLPCDSYETFMSLLTFHTDEWEELFDGLDHHPRDFGRAILQMTANNLKAYCEELARMMCTRILRYQSKNSARPSALFLVYSSIVSQMLSWLSRLGFLHQFVLWLCSDNRVSKKDVQYCVRGELAAIVEMCLLSMFVLRWRSLPSHCWCGRLRFYHPHSHDGQQLPFICP